MPLSVIHLSLLLLLLLLLVVGCSRPTNNKSEPPVASVASVASLASASAPPPVASFSPPPSPVAVAPPTYPVGRECSKAEAIAKEKRTPLGPASEWKIYVSRWQRLTARLPDKVFLTTVDKEDGLRLISTKEKAHELGPDGKDRHFSMRIRRTSKSIDELLADKSKNGPLGGVYVEGAFPKRTVASFVESKDEPIGSGAALKTKLLGGKDAYVFVNGVEGYNTDTALIAVAPKETLIASADWNSSIMVGQPECWQRQVIGGVVENLVLDEAAASSVKTAAGNLEIVETKPNGFGYELRVAGKTIVKTDQEDPKDKRANGPHPSVVRSLGAIGSSFDEVLFLRWDGMGNACNGYGYSFLQLKKDGTASLVDLDWCGGPEAELTLEGSSKVIVHRPRSKPNRGDGWIPAATWIYENGVITEKK